MGTDELEDRVQRIEYAVWGLRGDNGLSSEVRAIRDCIRKQQAADAKRREEEAEKQRNRDRALLLAAASSIVGLIGVIVTLIVVLQGAA